MPARGTITYVTLDDTGLEIGVIWGATVSETIRVDADSLQATLVRGAAQEVVEQHLAHLQQDGYVIGEPPPGGDDEEDGIGRS